MGKANQGQVELNTNSKMEKKEQSGIELIAAERQRQIEKEGWTAEHDKYHDRHELLDAARCYIISSEACSYSPNNVTFNGGYRPNEGTPRDWPWDDIFWKPTGDPVKDLIKAGALIAAEIDRLQNVVGPLNH